MPRIPREAHAAIRRQIDVENRKVAEVAAAYGCTPANIYAILARLRRQDAPGEGNDPPVPGTAAPEPAADLFAETAAVLPVTVAPAAPALDPADPPSPMAAGAASPVAPSKPPADRPSPTTPARSKPVVPATRPNKTGYALLMRTGDGEEAVNPFRSLDELLAASKPILRTAARSPEPIWFSIQQVDLEALEDGA